MKSNVRAAYKVADKPTLAKLLSPNPSAGKGAPTYDLAQYEIVDLNKRFYTDLDTAYLLEIEGDSMIGAGIQPGDLVSADYSRQARNHDIIVAALNGEMLVKRLLHEHGITYLVSENHHYQRREIFPDDSFQVLAVVTGAHKCFLKF